MKRDITVWLSPIMIAVAVVVGIAMGMPLHLDQNAPPVFHVLFWMIVLGAVRVAVLWFQTLVHGVKHAKEENLAAVVLGHLILGPLMAYAYYLSCRFETEQPSNAG